MMNHALRSRRETIALQSKRFIAALCFMSLFALSFILAAIGKQPATANPKAQVENTERSNSYASLE